ncbi:OLC1v1003732C2 [Oldenlandia corymbosa var. corymbosa]|uniref:OLC1v1003732C2 n=1 Tax=Oldenlandia corymbosa var. corymbosa TaxID=529605 RepID=A0AAV1DE30_OLDCO|nr:OLC1v1003732C2 [Oldenlandia corymbosa var. corymbosa]
MLRSSLKFLFQWLFLMLLFFPIFSATKLRKTPRLSPFGPKFLRDPSKNIFSSSSLHSMKDFETKFYEQTLDHFNYQPQSYSTFKQKYVTNSRYWGGANSSSPILAYLGAESSLGDDFSYIGPLSDNAPRFKALLIYIEHRFYGESIPFGLEEDAILLKNESIRGYFNSEQALADYAEILRHVKEIFGAPKSPIIVVGGSYGGMLAAWFRLKYPHIAMGALAISAPILYFEDLIPHDAYFSVVQKDFKEQSESCFKTIEESWDIIYKIGSKPNGLSLLSRKFKSCSKLKKIDDLSEFIVNIYSSAAQYNEPPRYPVKLMCDAIDGAPDGTDVLGRILAGIQSLVGSDGNRGCYDLRGYSDYLTESWDWQTCTEMVIPIGGSDNITIVREKPFNMKERNKQCKRHYGVVPRPHWVTTYYGGYDIKMVLRKFGSNIIFSNGLRDPWSRAGVLENLSDGLLAVYTIEGSYSLQDKVNVAIN